MNIVKENAEFFALLNCISDTEDYQTAMLGHSLGNEARRLSISGDPLIVL